MALDPTIKRVARKIPLDMVKGRIKIRERHINAFLGNTEKIKRFMNARVGIMDSFINIKGQVKVKQFNVEFDQKVFLNDHIDMKDKFIKVEFADAYSKTDDTGRNTIKIELGKFKKLEKYLDKANNMNIVKDLSIDEVHLSKGELRLVSKNRLELLLREEFIQRIIDEEIVKDMEMMEYLKIEIMDGYFNLNAVIKTDEFSLTMNKAIAINKFNPLDDRTLELEVSDYNNSESNNLDVKTISLVLDGDKIDIIKKYMDKAWVKFLVSNLILTKDHLIKCVKDEKAIVIYRNS